MPNEMVVCRNIDRNLVRAIRVFMSLFVLHAMLCLFGTSFIAMAVRLAQLSWGLQLSWAAENDADLD